MEVEAKFSIPDYDTLVRLRTAVRLGPYTLSERTTWQVFDRYLDTSTWALRRQGYSCRVRRKDSEWIATVKGLGTAESAVHQRFESEAVLTREPSGAVVSLTDWPAWEGRELVASLIGPEPLEDLFLVEQVRDVRDLRRDDRLIAELSIDEGQILARGNRRRFQTLEAELVGEGTRADLQALEEHLVRTWGLAPEPQSKYELGVALLSDRPPEATELSRLSAGERERLSHIAAQGDPRLQARARLILGWAEGRPIRVVTAEAHLSRSWAYELLERFQSQRLAMFPAELTASTGGGAVSVTTASGSGLQDVGTGEMALIEADAAEPALRQQLPTIAETCERFHVDQQHSHWVATQAMALFGTTAPVHGLTADRGRLLQAMCMLHHVGLDDVRKRRRTRPGELLLQHPIADLTQIEQQMVAAAVYLHRKPAKRRRREAPLVTALPPDVRRETLALAALLRMADGLDTMRSQTTRLGSVQVTSAAIDVTVHGPFAGIDALRAQSKADLWAWLFGVPVRITATASASAEVLSQQGGGPLEVQTAPELLYPVVPGIRPDDTLAEAGRKVLHVHLLRMLINEPATRVGKEPEALHDMRVATRRMRAALRVFGTQFGPRTIRPFAEGLRATAQVLGAVRDQDVLLAKARAYLKNLPADQAHDLDPLLDAWQALRNQARDEMLSYLDSERYQDFAEKFLLFLRSPGAGVREQQGEVPEPLLVCHLAPRLIYTRWARVLAFGPHIEGAPAALLHALRIECKRLRYCLEFLAEVLGSEAKAVIAEVVCLQDHLGDLHDADVANSLLSSFLFPAGTERGSSPVIAPGVVSYLAAQQRELQSLMQAFPAKWSQFTRPEVRRWLANAVAAL